MSASKRAAAKILAEAQLKPGYSEFHWHEAGISDARVAEIVDAEYAPLVEAVRDEISSCPGCDGCGIVEDDYTDDEEICGECEALRKALAHIEGDATP